MLREEEMRAAIATPTTLPVSVAHGAVHGVGVGEHGLEGAQLGVQGAAIWHWGHNQPLQVVAEVQRFFKGKLGHKQGSLQG